MKNAIENINNRHDQAEKRTCELKVKSLEITLLEWKNRKINERQCIQLAEGRKQQR